MSTGLGPGVLLFQPQPGCDTVTFTPEIIPKRGWREWGQKQATIPKGLKGPKGPKGLKGLKDLKGPSKAPKTSKVSKT